MNATVFTAQAIHTSRTAELERESLIRATQSERPAPAERPTGFAVVTDWFRGFRTAPVLRTAH